MFLLPTELPSKGHDTFTLPVDALDTVAFNDAPHWEHDMFHYMFVHYRQTALPNMPHRRIQSLYFVGVAVTGWTPES